MRRFSVVMLLSSLLGCAQILDIEERTGTSETNVQGESSALCKDYCDKSKRLCTSAQKAELFYTEASCLGACAQYAVGDVARPTGNTLACRLAKLRDVDRLGEPSNLCPPAGIGGSAVDPRDSAGSCSSNCEGYCAMYGSVCGDQPDCVSKCKALKDTGGMDANADFASGADTLQCRMAHLSAAAAAKNTQDEAGRKAHCSHSGLKSEVQCDANDKAPVTCEDYCRLTNVACTGSNAVYETDQQCLGACRAMKIGTAAEANLDTIRCRREFGYLALLGTPATHCTNAGPAPAMCGVGGKCASYCALLAKGCEAQFGMKFSGSAEEAQAKCQAACGNLDGTGPNGTFQVNNTAATSRANSLQCRLLRLVQRLGGDTRPDLCLSAMGGAACGNETIP